MDNKPSERTEQVQTLTPLLAADYLFCERDERVLFQDLSFRLAEGQVLQIKGGNGSGKTTLLRILCGLNDNYQGLIRWRGELLANCVEEFRDGMLYLGHRVGISKVLTPRENLLWSGHLHRQISSDEMDAALAQVGLQGFEDSQCFTLSAGQHQRVSLARLLLSKARLWVLDEPFTTLDVRGVAFLENLIGQHSDRGGSVLVTTHHALAVDGLTELTLGVGQMPRGSLS